MTSVVIERDKAIEEEIKAQYLEANKYYKECMAELENKHKKHEQWI